MNVRTVIGMITAALLLAGCTSLLNSKNGGPSQVNNVPVGNPLTLPPDLSLRAPTTTADSYQPNTSKGVQAGSDGLYDDSMSASPPPPPPKVASAAPNASGDVYAQYGISKLKPDGTPKDQGELREELRQAVIARKKAANPNYGSVFNIGNVFKDE